LSPNNIFFGLNGSAKLGDFGSAKEVDESFQATISEGLQDPQSKQVSVTGTDPYIAPELLNSSSYNHKVDVYSLGIILFEIIMGPFKTDSERSSHITKLKSSQTPPELQDIIVRTII
jgi:serine/threonine protein kinase